jgi:mono/diheme cytochrome c family protein
LADSISSHSAGSSNVPAGRARGWQGIRPLVTGVVLGVVVAAGLGAVVLGPLALSHRQDLPLEQKYGSYAVTVAAKIGSTTVGSPPTSSQGGIAGGRAAYTGSCGSCHGATGDGRGAFGPQTYPLATDLTSENVKEKSDAELFWITKNGLSFTAMPGFSSQYDDQTTWQIVQYVRALQSGKASTVDIPAPTMAELQVADPNGSAVNRGAAVYFAQGCQYCHGAVGKAPAGFGLRGGGGESAGAIRGGRRGMPAYSNNVMSDAELSDLEAYMATFGLGGGSSGGGGD